MQQQQQQHTNAELDAAFAFANNEDDTIK